MKEIFRHGQIRNVYSKEEADKQGIEYTEDWVNANAGDMCLSDDGMVAELLYKSKLYWSKKRENDCSREYKFTWGRIWWRNRQGKVYVPKLEAKKFMAVNAHNRGSAITWGASCVKNRRIRTVLKVYIQQLLANKVDLEHLGNMLFKHHKRPDISFRKVLKQKEVKTFVEEELIQRMADIGIDQPKNWALKMLKEAYEFAVDQRNPDSLVKIAKEINTLTDAYPKKVTATQTLEYSGSQEYLEKQIAKEEEKLVASRSVTIDSQKS